MLSTTPSRSLICIFCHRLERSDMWCYTTFRVPTEFHFTSPQASSRASYLTTRIPQHAYPKPPDLSPQAAISRSHTASHLLLLIFQAVTYSHEQPHCRTASHLFIINHHFPCSASSSSCRHLCRRHCRRSGGNGGGDGGSGFEAAAASRRGLRISLPVGIFNLVGFLQRGFLHTELVFGIGSVSLPLSQLLSNFRPERHWDVCLHAVWVGRVVLTCLWVGASHIGWVGRMVLTCLCVGASQIDEVDCGRR